MDLLDLLKKIYEKCDKLEEIFPDNQFLDEILRKIEIEDMIMDSYGIPKDNTVELASKYSSMEEAIKDKDFFCRDYWTDLLFEFGKGEIKKEKVLKELKNWQKI